jgi:hypothetical protein
MRERRALATSRAGDSLVGGTSRDHRELFGERALRSIHTAKPRQMERAAQAAARDRYAVERTRELRVKRDGRVSRTCPSARRRSVERSKNRRLDIFGCGCLPARRHVQYPVLE